MDSSGSSGSAGSAAEEMVHGAFLWEKVSGAEKQRHRAVWNMNVAVVLNTFLCSSLPGEMIEFDDHIFPMGWNHQLDEDLFFLDEVYEVLYRELGPTKEH